MEIGNKAKKEKGFRSLKKVLTSFFLFLSLFLLLSTNFAALFFNFSYQRTAVAEKRHLIAKNAADMIKYSISNKLDIVRSTIRLIDPMTAQQSDQKMIMERVLGYEPAFRQIVLFDSDFQESIRVSRLSNLTSGQFTAQIDDELFAKIKSGKVDAHISPVYIDEISAEPLILFALPVTDVLRDFRGMIVGEINLKSIWDLVGSLNIGRTGQAYIVDNKGNLIAFSDISRVLKGENLLRLKEVDEFVNHSEVPGADIEMSFGISGNLVLANFVALETPDWAVITELPIIEAYELIIQQLLVFAPILLFSIILTVISSFYLSQKITKPIIDLKNAAENIGSGNLDTQIEIKANNEIGELARTFNLMVVDLGKSRQKLQDYSLNLEDKVSQRTSELVDKNKQLEKFNKLAVGRELKMIELKKKIKDLESAK